MLIHFNTVYSIIPIFCDYMAGVRKTELCISKCAPVKLAILSGDSFKVLKKKIYKGIS